MRKYTISGTTRLYPPSLLLKIYVLDIFLILKTTYFTGYADGSMSFVVGDDTTDALKVLE